MSPLARAALLAACLACALPAQAQRPADARVEIHFTGEALADRVRQLVADAKHRVWLMAYSMTDVELLENLQAKAKDESFDLRILIDGPGFRDLTKSKDSKSRDSAKLLRSLTRSKRVSQVTVGRDGGLQHIKLMLIDDRILVAGSQNWSALDSGWQRNDVFVIHDRRGALIKAARKAFETVRDRDWASDGTFKPGQGEAPDSAHRARVTFYPVLPPSLTGWKPKAGQSDEPPQPGRERLIKAIQRSRRIWVAMFVFTDAELGKLLVTRAGQRADVRVLVDRVQYQNLMRRKGSFSEEQQQHLQALERVGRLKVFPTGTLHHKLAILDREVWTGSANWTIAGFQKNAEVLFSLALDKQGYQSYADYFAGLWEGQRE